jgi:hypothetical protein
MYIKKPNQNIGYKLIKASKEEGSEITHIIHKIKEDWNVKNQI